MLEWNPGDALQVLEGMTTLGFGCLKWKKAPSREPLSELSFAQLFKPQNLNTM